MRHIFYGKDLLVHWIYMDQGDTTDLEDVQELFETGGEKYEKNV